MPEILLQSVNFEKFTSINHYRDQPQTCVWRAVIGRGSGHFWNDLFESLLHW